MHFTFCNILSDPGLYEKLTTGILAVIFSSIVTFLISMTTAKRNHKEELENLNGKYGYYKNKYESVKEKLSNSGVDHPHRQTVILCGPISIGKTSFLKSLEVPWDNSKLPSTAGHQMISVIAHELKGKEEAHFADNDILIKNIAHQIYLDIHDFPGEKRSQSDILTKIAETSIKEHGVILICMVNALDAKGGQLSTSVKEYYSSEFFLNLRKCKQEHHLDIRKVIVIFNKFDLLELAMPHLSKNELLNTCVSTYDDLMNSFIMSLDHNTDILYTETILARQDKELNALIVKGHCIKNIYIKLKNDRKISEIMHFPDLPYRKNIGVSKK